MLEEAWIVVNLCNHQATMWLVVRESQPIVEKKPLKYYVDPKQSDSATRIDLAFFEDKDSENWLPYKRENEKNFEGEKIPYLMDKPPNENEKYLRAIFRLVQGEKEYPLIFITDKDQWKSALQDEMARRNRNGNVILLEKPMDFFIGYAFLDVVHPSLDALCEFKGGKIVLEGGRTQFITREGLFFYVEENGESGFNPMLPVKNLPNLVGDWDELARLGTTLFYLIWRPLLEKELPDLLEKKMRQVMEGETLLRRMRNVKQRIIETKGQLRPAISGVR
ncbi:MAG: hypothetical protein QXP38_12005 [Nitrososphaerota archaeon]